MGNMSPSFGKDLVFKVTMTSTSTSLGEITDISRDVMSVDGLPGEREFADVTCGGGAVAHEWLTGMIAGDITLQCLVDQATSSHASAWKAISTATTGDTAARYFGYWPAGESSGYPQITGQMRIKSVVLGAKPLEPLTFTVTAALDSTISVATFTSEIGVS